MSHVSFKDRVEQYLKSRPNQWVDSMEIERIGGRCAWRTRLSNLRVDRGMTIENRLRRIVDANGNKFTKSEYRYIPAVREPEQLTLHEARG